MASESTNGNGRKRGGLRGRKRGRRERALVAVVGSGGNIGSHVVGHVARIPEVGKIILVDPDVYAVNNLLSQDISRQDLGRRKVDVQARRLSLLGRSLEVVPLALRVQDVPLGLLRADVILSCLDSREARRVVNQAAFRLGVPWIDAGVDGRGLLARVNAYLPGAGEPCLECGWDERDYRALEQTYPCSGGSPGAPPTEAPSSLGALAASLQATECGKLLRREMDRFIAGRQLLLDIRHHRHFLTLLPRSASCRFDHARWEIEVLGASPRALTLADLPPLARGKLGVDGEVSLTLEEHPFAARWACVRCGRAKDLLHLVGRLRASRRSCPACGSRLAPVGFEVEGALVLSRSGPLLGRTLGSLGFLPGDVVALGNRHGKAHFQLGGME